MEIIDASGFMYAYFYGFPPMARPSDNHPVGIIHGLCSYLWALSRKSPDHVAVVFDKGRSAHRVLLYPEYKAQRKPPPDDLRKQIPIAKEAVRAFGMCVVEMDEVEADDLIATHAKLAVQDGHSVCIHSVDKDLYQLVSPPAVTMFDPRKNIPIGPEEVFAKFGVLPHQMGDLLALWGDASDNIPGITRVGPKTAAGLISKFGDLDSILDNAHLIDSPALKRNVMQEGWKARLARKLVMLDESVPVIQSSADFAYAGPDPEAVLAFLDRMELPTLREDIEQALRMAA